MDAAGPAAEDDRARLAPVSGPGCRKDPSVPDIDLETISRFCADVAAECSEISLRYFRNAVGFEQKEDLSPVTIADRTVEAHMRQRIGAAFPEHGIVGEEMEAVTGDRYTWYIDPIDGTKSFISGMPLYGLLMALRDNRAEQTVLGMIDIPALGERWIGHSGQAALNGRPVRVSGCRSLAEAQVYTTSPDIFAPADWAAYERVSRAARFRRFGGDCYIYGLMAAGHCDLVVETSLYTFDFMALIPVIEGAGGLITDWDGRPLTPASDGRVIAAATPELLEETLARLHGGAA